MLDSHIHFGQFDEVYYDFDRTVDAIFNNGIVDKIVYSSTTSCICDVEYAFVRNEIEAALKKYSIDVATPLFWFVPDYINQGVSINAAMNELNYGGFKLHPLGNEWDFENCIKQSEALHQIFDYADKHIMQILIHTGESGVDRPGRFERFFAEYKNATIILAHCRPASETIKIMKKYPNVLGDTAFAPKNRIDEMNSAGLGKRIIFGTDFPITHYYYGRDSNISLQRQYELDCNGILPYLFNNGI